jgi:hypothetical protein
LKPAPYPLYFFFPFEFLERKRMNTAKKILTVAILVVGVLVLSATAGEPAPAPPPVADNAAHVRPLSDWNSKLSTGTGEAKEFKLAVKPGDVFIIDYNMKVNSAVEGINQTANIELGFEIRETVMCPDNAGNLVATFSILMKTGRFNDKDLTAAAGEKPRTVKALITPQGFYVKGSIDKSGLDTPPLIKPEMLLEAILPVLPNKAMKPGEAVAVKSVIPEHLLTSGGEIPGESPEIGGVYEFAGIDNSSGAPLAKFKIAYEIRSVAGSVETISALSKEVIFDMNSGYEVSASGSIDREQINAAGGTARRITGKSEFTLKVKREEPKPAETPKEK